MVSKILALTSEARPLSVGCPGKEARHANEQVAPVNELMPHAYCNIFELLELTICCCQF